MKQEKMRYDEFRALEQDKTSRGNRKVLNAEKTEQNGIMFASRLERYMYNLLKMAEIPFEFQKRYTLQEGFRYNGEAVRPITYTADFWLPGFDLVIDTKGLQTQQGALRIKLLKHRFAVQGLNTRIELPQDRYACVSLVCALIDTRKKH